MFIPTRGEIQDLGRNQPGRGSESVASAPCGNRASGAPASRANSSAANASGTPPAAPHPAALNTPGSQSDNAGTYATTSNTPRIDR